MFRSIFWSNQSENAGRKSAQPSYVFYVEARATYFAVVYLRLEQCNPLPVEPSRFRFRQIGCHSQII
jgi:hypothetical protein